MSIIKKDGTAQAFDRDKLKMGIIKACKKTTISPEKIDSIVEWVEKKLKNRSSPRIKSQIIGELIMKKLRMLDEIAYLRFASVYRSFDDIKSFEKELKELKRGRKDGR